MKKNTKEWEHLGVRMSTELKQRLLTAAQRSKRSMSQFVELAVEREIERQERETNV